MMTEADKGSSSILRWWVKNLIFCVLIGVALFWSAGSLKWWMGWVYLGVILFIILVDAAVMGKALMAERSEIQAGTKKWDIPLASFVAIWGPLLICLTAGLDRRFGWSGIFPMWLNFTGLGLVLLGGLFAAWAIKTNNYFSATVRIQTDRAQQVIQTGPYAWLRHPGYAGGLFYSLFVPLLLGSWFALIPAGLLALGFIWRTRLEDRTLQTELPGYAEYARQVRYRLFPGIW
jgi:protein-S-isoprenylcysteine O-methyltransferase Ste14